MTTSGLVSDTHGLTPLLGLDGICAELEVGVSASMECWCHTVQRSETFCAGV